MYNIIYYDMHAESNFATHIIILLMYESRRIIMEFVICDDDRLYASQFIEQLKVLESQYDELFNCVYYDHYENFMESLRNKECDKADYSYLDYMYYGHLLESLKKYDDAVVQYEKAVKMDPKKTDLYKNISSAYEQKNDYKKAISAYQKYYSSLDKEKQTPDLQFQFGRLYYGAGTQPDSLAITVEERKQALMSADSTFHAIAEAAPDSYLGNFWRARANSALDPETTQGLAKPFYEEVAALLESKNDPHYNSALVECYSYLGYYYLLAIENPALKAEAKANKDKSIEYWSKILAIDPANATAKRALDGIK